MNGHSWCAFPNVRSTPSKACGCRCNRKRVLPERSLAYVAPAAALERHLTRNGALTPLEVHAHASRAAWFVCAQGHEMPARLWVIGRAGNRRPCAVCARRHVTDTVAERLPLLARCWSPLNRKAADQVASYSKRACLWTDGVSLWKQSPVVVANAWAAAVAKAGEASELKMAVANNYAPAAIRAIFDTISSKLK